MENLNDYAKKQNNDVTYWNNYYEKHLPKTNAQSKFAEFVLPEIEKDSSLIELGCGNGRDTLFFIKNGINVTAIDGSSSAINMLDNAFKSDNAKFICDDFVKTKILDQNQYDYCYSRFTWHSISEEQENELIIKLQYSIKQNGKLFIEARSVNDDIYGLGVEVAKNAYFYEGHFRRFLVLDEICEKLSKYGFEIVYAEEGRGFAPYINSNPVLIRIIGIKN